MTSGPSPAILAGPRRILITSPMKCGSTYVAHILARYLGTDVPPIAFDWLAEHRVTPELNAELRGRPFVVTLHLLPHQSSLMEVQAGGVHVAVQWRNVADTVVSFDDHTRRYGAHNPIFRLDDDRYARLPQQARFRYVLDRLVPWSLDFYLRWRDLPGLIAYPYEWMVRDPFAFFRLMLWQLGVPLDDARLRDALADVPEGSRFNVGVVGRAAHLFDESNKRRLERHILDHPEFDELEVLLWELPWQPLELARVSPHDGTSIRAGTGDEEVWFVSRGIRRAVDQRWIASRGAVALRDPVTVTPAQLAALPEGTALR